MKRRRKRSTTDDASQLGRRPHPMKRRLLMIAIVAVVGWIIFLMSTSANKTEGGEGVLEGKITLDGNPFGGATLSLRAEDRSNVPTTGRVKVGGPAINRLIYRSRSDADGRYRATLRPGLVYTINVSRPDAGKDPLKTATGELPTVEVPSGVRHFDITLSSH